MEERDWLRNNSQPLQTVLEKWENTYNWRMSYIEEGHTLEEILEEWPLYRQNFGYKLVESNQILSPEMMECNIKICISKFIYSSIQTFLNNIRTKRTIFSINGNHFAKLLCVC